MYRSSFTGTIDRKGHVQVHVVTSTFKVTLEDCSVDLCLFDFEKWNYIQNKTKIISLAYPRPRIGSVIIIFYSEFGQQIVRTHQILK